MYLQFVLGVFGLIYLKKQAFNGLLKVIGKQTKLFKEFLDHCDFMNLGLNYEQLRICQVHVL